MTNRLLFLIFNQQAQRHVSAEEQAVITSRLTFNFLDLGMTNRLLFLIFNQQARRHVSAEEQAVITSRLTFDFWTLA